MHNCYWCLKVVAKRLRINMKKWLWGNSYTIKSVHNILFHSNVMCFPQQTPASDCEGEKIPGNKGEKT